MKMISPDAKFLFEYDDQPLKKVELAARTCYKSEDKITDTSADKFVKGLAKHGHYAMLEHARVTFEVRGAHLVPSALLTLPMVGYTSKVVDDGTYRHYITLSMSHIFKWKNSGQDYATDRSDFICTCWMKEFYAAFNKRYNIDKEFSEQKRSDTSELVVGDVTVVDDIRDIYDFDMDDFMIHKYMTCKFICDRGVSHEIVRHRASMGQESTRYCCYANEKFGNELTIIKPAKYDEWNDSTKAAFQTAVDAAEATYMSMIEHRLTPQEARAVLPNCLKTELVMTAPVWQWIHFFNLRYFGTTGAPHPDMKEVAEIAYHQFAEYNREYLQDYSDIAQNMPAEYV